MSAAADVLPLSSGTTILDLGNDDMAALLSIPIPPLTDAATAFRQLNALATYARHVLGALSVLIEDEYVD